MQSLDLIIVCEEKDFFNWIASTVQVSNIIVKKISQIGVEFISNIKAEKESDQLLIIEDKSYAKYSARISETFSSLDHELPLLVVTDTYTDTTSISNTFTIIDTIVKPSLSIHSLEHAIRSLLKDYKLTQRLKKLVHYDALTGAANRYLFDDRMDEMLKKSKREKEPCSILYFDLNRFKTVNDNHGHSFGDLLLKHFVTQLNRAKRETDTLARLGGDEFCMLIPNTTKETLSSLVNRIKNALITPVSFSNIELYIRTAIGGVNINDQSASQLAAKDILKIADKCVYEAKKEQETHFVLESV